MRRARAVLAAGIAILAAAAPASGAIRTYVVAASGTAVPNGTIGGILPYASTLLVAQHRAVYFAANVGGSEQWIYRWHDGEITLVTQLARDIIGDDQGTLAWTQYGADKCYFSVLASGATTPARAGCTGGAIASVYANDLTVMGGSVYFVGHAPGQDNMAGPLEVFRDQSPVAVVPDGTFNSGIPGIFDDGQSIYLVGYYDHAIGKLVGGTIVTVLGQNRDFVAFAPDRILYGTPTHMYEQTAAGTVDLSEQYGRLWIGRSADVLVHQTDQLLFDRLLRVEDDGLHPIVGIGSKTVDGWTVAGVSEQFATAHDDDGTTAFIGAVRKGTNGGTTKQAVLVSIDECLRPQPVGEIPLDAQDTRDAGYEAAYSLSAFVAQVKKAIAALKADSKKHPAHKARNDEAIRQLELQLPVGGGGFRSLSAHARVTDGQQDLLDNAKCSWLDDASKTMKEAAEGKHAKEISQLGDRLLDLKKVLNGDAKPGSPEAKKLLETNLVALGERVGGDNGGKLTGKALKLYNVLTGQIAQKDLPAVAKSEIADLAKVLGGKNAGELATQITTLVDVLRGNVDADKQYEVLKDSISALATRIGVEGLLNAPQARAAMLGFEIGKAFADRISVDLQLVADRELKLACLNALAVAQGVGHSIGEIDYTKKTAAFTDANASHAGWSCTIRPDTNVAGYDNHTLIEAYKPPKIYLGVFKTGDITVWFDPSF